MALRPSKKAEKTSDAVTAKAPLSGVSNGVRFDRRWATAGKNPLDEVEYTKRDSVITNPDGSVVFQMKEVEVPLTWSQLATDIIVSKYFRKRGVPGVGHETSARQVVYRIAHSIREAGENFGHYFATRDDADAFEADLSYMLIHQLGAFNSPVWFNCGLGQVYNIGGSGGNWSCDPTTGEPRQTPDAYSHPQCSACFIQSVNDDLMSIFELAKNEARLFKYGSGTGTNFSRLRGRQEKLSGGGTSSGLMSFLEVLDRGAGATKSGGTTRRAAKMVCLDLDHPEIVDFIGWKSREEKKVRALIKQGYSADFNGEAYKTVAGQNSNNSVRVPDDFMYAYLNDGEWQTKMRTTGEVCDTLKARDLMHQISKAAWECADPGVQFDTSINKWHTCKTTDRIHGSNPCVTGDTLVATTEGLKPIMELVGKTADILTFDGRVARVSEIFPTGFKDVYELRTQSGYSLKLTADHKVWTKNRGDVPASELTSQDEVVLVPGQFGQVHLDQQMAEFIGLALGDGCKANDAQGLITLTMGNDEATILEDVVAYLNTIKADRKIAGVRFTDTGSRVSTSAEVVTSVVDRYAILNEGSEKKRLLPEAFSLDRASVAAVLRGLFTTDGTVAHYGDKSQYVSLDSTSLEMLRQVQTLLLSFGIKSKLYENRRAGKLTAMLPDGHGGLKESRVQEMHSLRISRSSRVLFEEMIGFLPKSAKSQALRKLNESVGTYRDEMSDCFASLTKLGTQKVYDLTEPLTHHFVANGIVVHNCSEYMFLDDSACNLASINLMKFYDAETGVFDVDGFRHACKLFITAQEILVDFSSYPTAQIAQNSHDYRPLGLGYANLGTMLMVNGTPYDSDEGRAICSALTAIMTGHAYAASAEIAQSRGAFPGYAKNRESMLDVMRMHRDAAYQINASACPTHLWVAAKEDWDIAVKLGEQYGYRNAQSTVIAPTGTIGLLMDCDTTGIEPDYTLVKFKKLAGGGYFKIVNQSLPLALKRLGYSEKQIQDIVTYVKGTSTLVGAPHINTESLRAKGFTDEDLSKVEAGLPGTFDLQFAFSGFTLGSDAMRRFGFTPEQYKTPGFNLLKALGFTAEQIEAANIQICGKMTVEGAPHLQDAHLPAFDCANKCGKYGTRFLAPMAHVTMMGAAQPFISGAISKTINMPNESTIEEIEKLYVESWRLGLKACALYRDGSKAAQPLNSKSDDDTDKKEDKASAQPLAAQPAVAASPVLRRKRLTQKRSGFTQEARVGGQKVYLRTGEYPDGSLGELFIDMHKEGAAFRSMMNCFAIAVSLGLQYGVPLQEYVECFTFTRFEPNGVVDHPNVKMATSVIDYVFRVLGMEYLGRTDFVQVKPESASDDDVALSIKAKEEVKEKPLPKGLEVAQKQFVPAGERTKTVVIKPNVPPPASEKVTPLVVTKATTVQTTSGAVSQYQSSFMGDAPFCDQCGHTTVRNGSCYRCTNCGNSMGCS
jgi:ribonucleoside-diphosphate reductase alpha chain